MGAGLSKHIVPVMVDGAIDTKTNPKLVQGPALLELENLRMLRTGEMRLRDGFAKLTALQGNCGGMVAAANGQLLAISRTTTERGGSAVSGNNPTNVLFTYPGKQFVGVGSAQLTAPENASVFSENGAAIQQAPVAEPVVWDAVGRGTPTTTNDSWLDGDIASTNGFDIVTIGTGFASGAVNVMSIFESATKKLVFQCDANQITGLGSVFGNRTPVCAAANGYLVMFYTNTASPASIFAATYNTADATTAGYTVAAATASGVNNITPLAVKTVGNLIAVAYKASAGGVTCCLFNPATGAITSSVTTAGADAIEFGASIAWLDDSLGTSNLYLVTAGFAAGIVVRTMSNSTMVVSATNVIDAASASDVYAVTGHLVSSATNYAVIIGRNLGSGGARLYLGRWTGAATVTNWNLPFNIVSKTFLGEDGRYSFLASTWSEAGGQTLLLLSADQINPSSAIRAVLFPVLAKNQNLRTGLTSVVQSNSIYTAVASRVVRGTTGSAATMIGFRMNGSGNITAADIGGLTYLSGGMLSLYDGNALTAAAIPVCTRKPLTLTPAAGGSMTPLKTYSYRVVHSWIDSGGRIFRSASTAARSVTLGAADTQVTVNVYTPRCPVFFPEKLTVEVYRAGPAEDGATAYNLVASQTFSPWSNGTIADSTAIVDTTSDASAASGEFAYFTGGVLENTMPPASRVVLSAAQRIWFISEEFPTEVWFSKKFTAGIGPGFNSNSVVRFDGDSAKRVTALGAIDARVVAFKDGSTWVVSGEGPDDKGVGGFNAPTRISATIGVPDGLHKSVVQTPDGIMFQSANGIYLLDQGFGLSYIGAPVEQYTKAANVVDAAAVTGQTLVRFVFANGRMLEYDYHHKRWYTHLLRVDGSTIVACANSSTLGWCYALANGTIYQETPGVYADVNVTSTAIVPRVSFPHLNLAGLNGYQRLYAVYVLIDVVGNHTLSVDCEFNYSGAVTGSPRTKALTTATPTYQAEYNPPDGLTKGTSVRPVVTASLAAGSAGFRVTGLSLRVGMKKGSNVPYTSRLT